MNGKIAVAAIVIIAVLVVASFGYLYISTQNNIVALSATVDEKSAQVAQELQRRYDLIPNIVNAAKAYITYEGSILENVTRLRAQWDVAARTGNLTAIDTATVQLESGVSSMTVTFENYPDLQASGVIQSLMISLEGTENRISTERMRYNEAVRDYNTAIASFPGSLWAAGWGYTAKLYFQAQIGATEVPPVNL